MRKVLTELILSEIQNQYMNKSRYLSEKKCIAMRKFSLDHKG